MYKFSLNLTNAPQSVNLQKLGNTRGKTGNPIRGDGPPKWEKLQRNGRSLHELEQICQERSEAAYKYGFEDGKKIGIQEGREEVRNAVACLNAIQKEWIEKRNDCMREVDKLIVKLSVAVAKRILHREVRIDPEVIVTIARESLRLVEDRKRVSIRVNPDDWKIIHEFETEIKSGAPEIGNFEIKEDSQVKQGGCIVESDSGIIDAQFDVQLDEIAMTLLEAI